MKKLISIFCAVALMLALTGCAAESGTEQSAAAALTADSGSESMVQTQYGQVTEIDGTKVTVRLAEHTQSDAPEGPKDGNRSHASADGGDERRSEHGNGQMPPDAAGQNDNPGHNQTPRERPSDGRGGFQAGTETAVYDLSDADIFMEMEKGQDMTVGTIEDLAVGDIVELVIENGTVTGVVVKSGMGRGDDRPGVPGGGGSVAQGDAANIIDSDGILSGSSYTSVGDDENALRVDGASVTLDSIFVDKRAGASSNPENGDFYGGNAALLATNGAQVTITDAVVTSAAQNGNGVFSYGTGTVVNISDSTITTTQDNSGGIQTTGGGTTNASNLTVDTSGNSSAAIRSDRGGGTVKVDGGSYVSHGYNSPAVYSTADIQVSNATLIAENSEALVIEGKNYIGLKDCEVSGNMSDIHGASSAINVHNVMIYQSMSGDAEVGTSTFTMKGGSLTGNNGDMFYVTNTHCVLTLEGAVLTQLDPDGALLIVSGNDASNGWGTAGANGAQVEFTARDQALEGDILVDSISSLTMTLSGSSAFTGTVNIVDNAEGGTAVDDNAAVIIEEGASWKLTGDCTLTSLENNGTIDFNGYTVTLADGTVLSR